MGSIFSKPKTPQVPKVDIEGDIRKYVEGYTKALPGLLTTEREYRPEFLGLNLGDVGTFLQGTPEQMGIFGLSGLAQQEAARNLAAARQADIASMTGMAPQFRGFTQALSPEAAAQVEAAQQEAARATQAARGLSPEDRRRAEQSARSAYASRGRLGGNEAIFAEALGREDIMANRRAEAERARGQAFGLAQQFYTAPGLAGLGSTPLSYATGQQQLGMGLGAIGSARPQMINPDVGVNIGSQHRANVTQARAAGAQAQAAHSAGMMGMIGNIIGGAAGAIAKSDASLKEDIKPTGKSTKDGIPIYTYRYHGGDQVYRGVMAQDVQRIRPDAVIEQDGYLAVDYSKI